MSNKRDSFIQLVEQIIDAIKNSPYPDSITYPIISKDLGYAENWYSNFKNRANGDVGKNTIDILLELVKNKYADNIKYCLYSYQELIQQKLGQLEGIFFNNSQQKPSFSTTAHLVQSFAAESNSDSEGDADFLSNLNVDQILVEQRTIMEKQADLLETQVQRIRELEAKQATSQQEIKNLRKRVMGLESQLESNVTQDTSVALNRRRKISQ